MTHLRSPLALAAASVALTALVTPLSAAYAAESVDLSRPATLERGANIALPHLEGTTVVDADLRIEVPGAVALLGTAADDYVVQVRRERGARYRVVRISSEDERTVLLRGQRAQAAELSDDGAHLVSSDWERRATLTAYDATDGSEVASRVFRIYPEVLDIDEGSVLISTWQPAQRTLAWDLATDSRTAVADQVGYQADLSADRLAVYTGDPYQGGDSQVVRVSDPDSVLWESARQRVYAFSEDGERAATVHILSDGVGPGEVQLREVDGTLLVSYVADWFARVWWEDADTVLLEANGRRLGATVRCDGTVCERATGTTPTSP